MRNFARLAFVVGLGICVAGVLALPAGQARAEDRQWDPSGQDQAVEGPFLPWGTWILRMPLPGPPNGPGGYLPMILTIHREGTAVSSSSFMFGGISPGTAWSSAVHDTWERTGPRTIETTCVSLSFNPGNPASQLGWLIGFVRNRLKLESQGDGDHLAGELNSEFLACPKPWSCPDVNDPAAPWTPRLVNVPVTVDRLIRVPPGPLVP
ncbi:MAG: hypothetical protein U0529_10610 [Thermoanaerobaculia bacterium]